MGLMLAMVFILAALEHVFVMPFMPPHTKPGLANIMVMYCAFYIGNREAYLLNGAKALMVLVTRGVIAGALSLVGGFLSLTVIILLLRIKKTQTGLGYAFISVMGAITHNTGQFLVVILLFRDGGLFFYFPVLMISGIAAGLVTGILLKILLPVLNRVRIGKQA
jgi:heptaprenyl diphosphate synthase